VKLSPQERSASAIQVFVIPGRRAGERDPESSQGLAFISELFAGFALLAQGTFSCFAKEKGLAVRRNP